MILIKTTTEIYFVKRLKDSTIKQGLIEQKTRCGLKDVKAVEVWPWGHHEESTTNLLDWYYFVFFSGL